MPIALGSYSQSLILTSQDNGHAFILRRYDTGAISLTTMFRAAFPLATEAEERTELQWVKDNHDLSGNNGSNRESHITRLAGTWVDPSLAVKLGDQYALGSLIKIVVDAQPDPNVSYKRSAKSAAASSAVTDGHQTTPTAPSTHANGLSQQISNTSILANAGSMSLPKAPTSRASPVSNRATVGSLPTPSPTAPQPNPPKRRKESSPVSHSTDSSSAKTPLRRSNRTKSPVPKSVAQSTPARSPKKRVDQLTPASDKVVVDEEGEKVEEMTTKELHDQDIREQKKLIEDLKAQRAVMEKEKAERAEREGDDEMAAEEEDPSTLPSTSKKRAREEGEPEFKFEFKEPEVGEREIATNGRVRFQLEPRTRSFAWGVAAFAMGMGAM